jgi:hypothetical protein
MMGGVRCRHRILLVSSTGGVLLELLALRRWWSRHDVSWAVVPGVDTRSLLGDARVYWLRDVSVAHPGSLASGLRQAWSILRQERPDVLVSAGTGPALPFFLLARMMGIPGLWVLTQNILRNPGVSGRLGGRLASRVLVQRPEALAIFRNAVLLGELY